MSEIQEQKIETVNDEVIEREIAASAGDVSKSEQKPKIFDTIKGWFVENRKLLITVFLSTFIFGLIAHAFGLLNLNLSHDVLAEFSFDFKHKVTVGRFLQPILRLIIGSVIVMPWLEGLIGFFFIACSAFIILKCLKIDKTIFVILISAIMVASTTMTSLIASYTHDFCSYTVALYFACLLFSYYQRHKHSFKWYNCIPIIVFAVVTCSLYQAYIAVAFSLIAVDFIVCLLNRESVKKELIRLLIIVGTLVVGVAVYYGLAYAVGAITGYGVTPSGGNNYNSIANIVKPLAHYVLGILDSYEAFAKVFFIPTTIVKSTTFVGSVLICCINGILLAYAIFALVRIIIKNKPSKLSVALVIIALLMLPLIMNVIIVVFGLKNELVIYANLVLYVLMIKLYLMDGSGVKKISFKLITIITAVLLSVIVVSNVAIANTCYVKKDLENKATLSTMTRVVDRLEETEGYVYGQTQVAFIGEWKELYDSQITNDTIINDSLVAKVAGMHMNNAVTHHLVLTKYFENALQYDIKIVDEETTLEYYKVQQVKDMAVFPSKDCVAFIDGILVFKISSIAE